MTVMDMVHDLINRIRVKKELPPKKYNPIICVDFDGVIHSYTSGWKGIDVIPDPPVEGAFDWLRKHLPMNLPMEFIYTGPLVQIYSSRSSSYRGRKAMKEWFLKHGFPRAFITNGLLQFPSKKPAAFLTVDDRCICFKGTFPTTKEMMDFKPWNYVKKDV